MPASHPNFTLIIGLGNPGRQYKNSYHNLGHLFIDYLTSGKKLKAAKKLEYLETDGPTLVKSLTFMNESDLAVAEAIKKFKIPPEKTLIVQDDSDIALGNYKISFGRSSAGHKGAESIIQRLRTRDFYRLRIGVRKARGKAGDFVLKPITQKDLATFNKLFSEIQTLYFKS